MSLCLFGNIDILYREAPWGVLARIYSVQLDELTFRPLFSLLDP